AAGRGPARAEPPGGAVPALARRGEDQVLAVRRPARVGALDVGRREALGLAPVCGYDPDLGVPAVLLLLHRGDGEGDEAAVGRERGRADGDDAVPVRGRERALGILLRYGLGAAGGRRARPLLG